MCIFSDIEVFASGDGRFRFFDNNIFEILNFARDDTGRNYWTYRLNPIIDTKVNSVSNIRIKELNYFRKWRQGSAC